MGGLENLQTAKKYYASTIDLTGGKNTRALFGICMVCFCFFLMAILLISSNYNKNNYYGFNKPFICVNVYCFYKL